MAKAGPAPCATRRQCESSVNITQYKYISDWQTFKERHTEKLFGAASEYNIVPEFDYTVETGCLQLGKCWFDNTGSIRIFKFFS
jgi:hypothetical protein